LPFGISWLPFGSVGSLASAAGTGAANAVGQRFLNASASASGTGAATAVSAAVGIISGAGTASGIGTASAVGVARQTISAIGNAAGTGAANAIDGTIYFEDSWGFGAEAFGAEAFAGPELPRGFAGIISATAGAFGAGAATAVSGSFSSVGVANASGLGTAAGVAVALRTVAAIGSASGFGQATASSISGWPITLPQCPILTSWNEQTQGNRINFKPEIGPVKLRRKTSAKNWLSNAEFRMNNTQLATFKTFYESTLQDGALPFVWPHPITKTSYSWAFVPKEDPQVTRMTPNTSKVQFRLVRL